MIRQQALETILPVVRALKEYRTVIAGDLRRGAQEASSAVIVTQAPPYRVKEILAEFNPKSTVKPRTCRIIVNDFSISIVSTSPEAWGACLLAYTGPFDFRICIGADAKLLKMKLDPNGLWLGKERIAGREERQIFYVLGIPYMRPQDRKRFVSEARWQRRQNQMRSQAPEERRKVFLAIDTVCRGRRKGNLPAKRFEIVDVAGVDVHATAIAFQWLERHRLITADGPKAWRVAPKIHVDKVCWIHGRILNNGEECDVCQRKTEKAKL